MINLHRRKSARPLKWKRFTPVFYAASTLLLFGCGGSGSSNTPAPVVVTPTPVPAPIGIERPDTPDVPPEGPDFHPADKGWVLSWSDEFDGTELDASRWSKEHACWGGGNNERQCYTDRTDNVDVVNGVLRLIALNETFTGPNFPGDSQQITQDYTSGKVLTEGLADWKYGRISMRAKPPEGQGTWPAFWMLAATDTYGSTWPLNGEIDIMESINLGARCDDCTGTDGENRTTGTLHFGNNYPDNRQTGARTQLADNSNPADAYHVWSIEWGEGIIKWYLDGVLYSTKTSEDWFTSAAPGNANAPFDDSFYLILNFAFGGNYPEPFNETGVSDMSLPNQFLIDWVRVYQCEEDLETGLACMETE